METILLQFPADFDPFTATDAQVACLVRQLWTEQVTTGKVATDPEYDAYGLWLEAEERRLQAERPELFAAADSSDLPF